MFHDLPLAGIVQQHGTKFLFWCVIGQSQSWSAWAYLHLTNLEAEAVEAANDLPSAISSVATGQLMSVAIAHEELGIIGHVDGVRYAALPAATRFLVSNMADQTMADSAAKSLRIAS